MVLPTRIQHNLSFLKNLVSAKNKKEFLRKSSDYNILAVVEICYNLIKFRYSLTPKQIDSLRVFAEDIRKISKSKNRQKAEKLLVSLKPKIFTRLIKPLLKQQ